MPCSSKSHKIHYKHCHITPTIAKNCSPALKKRKSISTITPHRRPWGNSSESSKISRTIWTICKPSTKSWSPVWRRPSRRQNRSVSASPSSRNWTSTTYSHSNIKSHSSNTPSPSPTRAKQIFLPPPASDCTPGPSIKPSFPSRPQEWIKYYSKYVSCSSSTSTCSRPKRWSTSSQKIRN